TSGYQFGEECHFLYYVSGGFKNSTQMTNIHLHLLLKAACATNAKLQKDANLVKIVILLTESDENVDE
ncbi:hypothetical protein R6Q59_013705, partial [Mikania micrantha]